MNSSEPRRIFIVGCSRSGTTLLQGMLANHSRVHTFPETGIFLRMFGMRGPILPWTWLGLTVGKERKALARLISHQRDAPFPPPPLPPRRVLLSRSISDAVGVLDGLARAQGKDLWVEKTPRHVFRARKICQVVPRSVCIHMVRRGEDVVASIVDRARRFPDRFPRQIDPAYGTREWNRAVRSTAAAVLEPGHAVVFYDRLVENVESTLKRICSLLNLDFQEAILAPQAEASFIRSAEGWKDRATGPVTPAKSKFDDLFDQVTRTRILRTLDQRTFQELATRAATCPGGILTGPGW